MGRALFVWLRRTATGARGQLAAAGAPGPDARWATGAPQQPTATASPATAQSADTAVFGAQQASVAEATATMPPPANPGVRYSPETLELLGQRLGSSQRLAAAEDRVAPVLGALPRDRWLVERYVLLGSHRIPFLILGETGVFALWATTGRVHWREIPLLAETANDVKLDLPGYTGEVRAGACRALAPDLQPRWWCRPGEAGAWVMGLNWVIPWLEHFGPEDGLGVKDIERLREMAGPRWGRRMGTALGPLIPGKIPGVD